MTKEEAIKRLKDAKSTIQPYRYVDEAIDYAVEVLEQEPSQPKTGHWITLKDEYGDVHEAVCSNCDKNGNHKWMYCPNCGAKMEVEK